MKVVLTLFPRDYDAVLFDLDGVLTNPELPREMERLDLRVRYRGHSLDLRVTRDSLRVRGHDAAAAPISLCVGDKVCEFVSGTTRVFPLNAEATLGMTGNSR